MSIETGGLIGAGVVERPVRHIQSDAPLTEVGELFYGVDAIRGMVNLSSFIGSSLSIAVGSTLRIAEMVANKGVNLANRIQPGVQPRPIGGPG